MSEGLKERVDQIPYWYHKIELPCGVTPGYSPIDAERYSIPADLTGKRVLDIGAWDGYWSFEALKRGAKEVVAIDDFSDNLSNFAVDRRPKWETFDLCKEALGYGDECKRIEMSVYDIDEETLGRFDVVFFFGTIYHLKHPLLALEKISAICDGSIHIETASLDEFSPYRGGLSGGFNRNEMVMEFYPTTEYGSNISNWWAPTLQCLGAMLGSVGFKNIDCWPLTDEPKELSDCRGFASGTKIAEELARPVDVESRAPLSEMKVAAVMSVPRLGFTDNMTCACEALWPLRIPLINVQGAFWGQCLERGMQQLIDANIDVIITVDYDTVFKRTDVEALVRLMHANPDVAAIVPVQRGRGGFPVLMSMKSKSGQPRKQVPLDELKTEETTKIASGHFGLTAIRTKDLLEIAHPWFLGQPNSDGQWGPGRVDDDIYFWKLLEKAGKEVRLANRVVVGHCELKIQWPDKDMQPVYQGTSEFHDNGKPENVWR